MYKKDSQVATKRGDARSLKLATDVLDEHAASALQFHPAAALADVSDAPDTPPVTTHLPTIPDAMDAVDPAQAPLPDLAGHAHLKPIPLEGAWGPQTTAGLLAKIATPHAHDPSTATPHERNFSAAGTHVTPGGPLPSPPPRVTEVQRPKPAGVRLDLGGAAGGGHDDAPSTPSGQKVLTGPWAKLQQVIDEIGAMSPSAQSPRPSGAFDFKEAFQDGDEGGGTGDAGPGAGSPKRGSIRGSGSSGLQKECLGLPEEAGVGSEEGGVEEGSPSSGRSLSPLRPGQIGASVGDWAAGKTELFGVRRTVKTKFGEVATLVAENERAQRLGQQVQKGLEVSKDYAKPKVDKVAGAARSGWTQAVDQYSRTTEKVSKVLGASAKSFEQFVEEQMKDEFKIVVRNDQLTDLAVARGAVYTLPYMVSKGCSICWEFRVKDFDLGFALRIRVQGMGGASEEDVFPVERYAAGENYQGKWTADQERAVVLVWDNSYSKLRGKTLAYRVQVIRPGEQNPPRPQATPPARQAPDTSPPASSQQTLTADSTTDLRTLGPADGVDVRPPAGEATATAPPSVADLSSAEAASGQLSPSRDLAIGVEDASAGGVELGSFYSTPLARPQEAEI